jgi:peptide/nickel transport system permease protein
MNPIFTTISSWFASVLTGAFFVEYVFNYKGLGDLTITALNAFDIPVILGASLFTISVFIMINTITDIVYHYIDPRVRI